MTTPPYAPISTGSNLDVISFEIRDPVTGIREDLTGATVTVTIKDEHTREAIVASGAGTVNSLITSRVQYVLADADVAKITYETTWLVEWKVVAIGGRTFRSPEPIRLPVRPRL